MNLDELRTVQSKERRKDSLQHLRDSFYADVAEYISDLKAQRKQAAAEADDPFSAPEVSQLTDEIETAEEVSEAVYERRVGKVVKLASFAAASMPVEEDGMTREEQALFSDLVARIEQNKDDVLAVLSGEESSPATGTDDVDAGTVDAAAPDSVGDSASQAPANPTTETPAGDSNRSPRETPAAGDVLSDAMGGETRPDEGSEPTEADAVDGSAESRDADGGHTPVDPEPAPPGAVSTESESGDAGADAPDATAGPTSSTSATPPTETKTGEDDSPADDAVSIDRTTVRITRDVGEIFGVDEREYDLAAEDVVTLPAANAGPLIDRDAAERLD